MTPTRLDPSHERLLRDLAPRVLGAVARRFGDFADAEDAVQEALIAAASHWPQGAIPDDPCAWLIRVAARRMVDLRRTQIARRRRETAVALPIDDRQVSVPEILPQPEEDDTLTLLFMCCHPALQPASAIALTLRAVGGLTTAEIARAFLVPEATMGQRIFRAKQAIRSAGARFELPDAAERAQRLDAVQHTLYLIFNEGYASSAGPSLYRIDLSGEAIRLARELRRVLPDDAETAGLLALMLLTDARRAARAGPGGEIVPLDEQDRSVWDRAAIAEGVALLTTALSRGAVGPYQLQAAIAAVHGEAKSWEETDWPQILALYGLLRRVADSPMVALNEAVAVAMVHGPAAGLERLKPLDDDPRVAGHHRLASVRAHLHERLGEREAAIALYRSAAEGTTSLPERNYLRLKAARLG